MSQRVLNLLFNTGAGLTEMLFDRGVRDQVRDALGIILPTPVKKTPRAVQPTAPAPEFPIQRPIQPYDPEAPRRSSPTGGPIGVRELPTQPRQAPVPEFGPGARRPVLEDPAPADLVRRAPRPEFGPEVRRGAVEYDYPSVDDVELILDPLPGDAVVPPARVVETTTVTRSAPEPLPARQVLDETVQQLSGIKADGSARNFTGAAGLSDAQAASRFQSTSPVTRSVVDVEGAIPVAMGPRRSPGQMTIPGTEQPFTGGFADVLDLELGPQSVRPSVTAIPEAIYSSPVRTSFNDEGFEFLDSVLMGGDGGVPAVARRSFNPQVAATAGLGVIGTGAFIGSQIPRGNAPASQALPPTAVAPGEAFLENEVTGAPMIPENMSPRTPKISETIDAGRPADPALNTDLGAFTSQAEAAMQAATPQTMIEPTIADTAPGTGLPTEVVLGDDRSSRRTEMLSQADPVAAAVERTIAPMDPSRYNSIDDYYADRAAYASTFKEGAGFASVVDALKGAAQDMEQAQAYDQWAAANPALVFEMQRRQQLSAPSQSEQMNNTVQMSTISTAMGSNNAANAAGNAEAAGFQADAAFTPNEAQAFTLQQRASDLFEATRPQTGRTLMTPEQMLYQRVREFDPSLFE